MSDFSIPHLAPVKFVKSLIYADFEKASVLIEFDYIPSLPMLIESAAQSSSGILNDNKDIRIGYLVTLRNIKLLHNIESKELIVEVSLDYKIEDYKYLSFDIIQNEIIIAQGSFSLALK
jgi:hypothetical protein